MDISKSAAQAIAEEIGALLDENINIMDESGIIIASTDNSRIGGKHDGARRIIEESLDSLYVSKDDETEYTRRGINLPLIVDGQIIGVVGITGDKDRVLPLGSVVKHMTEIMIEDTIRKNASRYDRRVHYNYISEWINNPEMQFQKPFIQRGKTIGIDITRPYRLLVLRFDQYQELSDSMEGQRLLDQMESSVRHEADRRGYIYLRQPHQQVLFLPAQTGPRPEQAAANFIRLIMYKYHRRLRVGIDSANTRGKTIHRQFEEADKATDYIFAAGFRQLGNSAALTPENLPDQYIKSYDDLGIEILVSDLSPDTMEEYLDKFFRNIAEEKRGEWISFIKTYFACEGSINRLSEAMYMHKNTIQYKLHKLQALTGLDIRLPSQAPLFYVAVICYEA